MNERHDIEKVVQLFAGDRMFCTECKQELGGGGDSNANHYLEQHAFVLLHVGSQTERMNDDFHISTVYVVGKPRKV